MRHAHRGHRAQRHPQPHARKRVPLVGTGLPRVRHLEPRYRRRHRPCAHPQRDHSHVRRHDARARQHIEPAQGAGGGAQRADLLFAPRCVGLGEGRPRSGNRVRWRGLRDHHAAGGHGHQARRCHGPEKLQRLRCAQEHARRPGNAGEGPGPQTRRPHPAGPRGHHHGHQALRVPGEGIRHPRCGHGLRARRRAPGHRHDHAPAARG